MILLFNFDVLNLLLKNNRGRNRRPNFICVDWKALNVDGGGLRQEPCLGPAEISSLRSWLNSRSTQGESKISTFSLI